ncbi:chloroplast 29 kDa ribonucleoprotein [Tribonema minus]|uniref:Chloroplast 29 kDa ribonucleoprotein n=1 Tax=Tribonema minus TaxID=303371 RepID=A0A836CC59_9STRA|nr:chloroplast 29 kDa ribonucleoprotein [Tribonema minus]
MSYGSEGCKLYVGNLGYDTNNDTLSQAFSQFGAVQEASVATDRETGSSRGFGFVTYGTPQEAQAAMDNLNNTQLDGRTIRVNLSQPRERAAGGGGFGGGSGGGGGASEGNKLFIGNLGWNTTTDDLHAAFGQYGQVQDAIVMTDRETGSSRGFGFVTYATADSAQAAIRALDGTDFGGRNIRVNISEPRQRY